MKARNKLEEQIVRVPLGGSLDQSVDPLLVQPGQVATAENVIYDKFGRVSKDPGLEELIYKFQFGASLGWKFTSVNLFSEFNDSLVVGGRVIDAAGNDAPATHTKLCQYEENHSLFDPSSVSVNNTRDNVWSPIGQNNIPYSQAGLPVSWPGSLITNKYYWFSCVGPVVGYVRLVAVERATGTKYVADFVLPNISKTRLLAVGTKVVFLCGGPATLAAAVIDQDDPSSVVNFSTISTLAALPVGSEYGWDCCVDVSGNYFIIIKIHPTTGYVRLEQFNTSKTLSYSLDIAETVIDPCMSICLLDFAPVLGCNIAISYTGASGNIRFAYIGNYLSGVVLGYPITIDTLAVTDYLLATTCTGDLQLNYVTGVTSDKGVRVVVNRYGQMASPLSGGNVPFYAIDHYFIDSTGAASILTPKYDYILLSKAETVRGRPYFVLGNENNGASLVSTDRQATQIAPEAWFAPEEISSHYKNMGQLQYDSSSDELLTSYIRNDYADDYAATGKIFKLSAHCRASAFDRSLLAGGGFICSFDGCPAECGYWHPPKIIEATSPAGGSLVSATYTYIATYEWVDGNGDIHISQPSEPLDLTASPGDKGFLWVSSISMGSEYKNTGVKIVVYRNTPTFPMIFFRVAVSDNNPYSRGVAISDLASDATAESQPQLYTTGGVLSNATPPPARILFRHMGRIWIVNDDDKREIWASKPKVDGVAPEFCPELTVRIPEDCTGISSQGDNILLFAKKRIYTVVGEGPNALGIGAWADAKPVSFDNGCTVEASVMQTDYGTVFQNDRGIFSIGDQVQLISDPIADELAGKQVVAVVPERDRQSVRFFLSGAGSKALVYDFNHQRWSTVSLESGEAVGDAGIYKGKVLHFSTIDKKIKKTGTAYNVLGNKTTMKIVTPWISLSGLATFKRLWWIDIVGTWKAPHNLIVKISQDYVPDYDQTLTFDCTTAVNPYLIRIKPARQKCVAVRLEIYDDEGWLACTGLQTPNKIYRDAHGLPAGTKTAFRNLVGGAGLSNGVDYYVVNPTTNDFQVSTTFGGTAINFTTDIISAEFSKRGNSCTLTALELHLATKAMAARIGSKEG